jgi:hypothetical protein
MSAEIFAPKCFASVASAIGTANRAAVESLREIPEPAGSGASFTFEFVWLISPQGSFRGWLRTSSNCRLS